jgi:hypothetical protein
MWARSQLNIEVKMHQIVEFAQNELGVTLYPGQAQALNEYYTSGRQNWLLLAGRRGGKSLLSDIVAIYESVVPSFEGMLRDNEDRYVIIVSVRQDNASLHIRQIGKLLKHSKALKGLIAEQTKDSITLSNGVVMLSLPASARAGRGFTVSTLILDELAHFIDSQGNASADQVFDAFTPALATFGDKGKVVITTTPMSRTGIVYDLFDRAEKGELDDWYTTRKPTQELNPKVSDRVITRAFQRDSLSAAVEYNAEFADPVANYLDGESLNRAVDRHRRSADKGEKGVRYIMAIDPATQQDRYAFTIMHQEQEQKILDYCHIIKPPVDPNAAEDLLMDLVRRFSPYKIRCDTAATVNRLIGKIPQLEYTPFTRPMKLRIYGALKESLNLGNLSLLDNDDLLDELKALQIRNGVDISAPKAGRVTHDDLADCLALCTDDLVQPEFKVSVIPNPLYGGSDYFDNSMDPRAPTVHPEDVTWKNCKWRSKGCPACVAELEAEGYFDQQEKESEELQKGIHEYIGSTYGPPPRPTPWDAEQAQIEKYKSEFRQRIR